MVPINTVVPLLQFSLFTPNLPKNISLPSTAMFADLPETKTSTMISTSKFPPKTCANPKHPEGCQCLLFKKLDELTRVFRKQAQKCDAAGKQLQQCVRALNEFLDMEGILLVEQKDDEKDNERDRA